MNDRQYGLNWQEKECPLVIDEGGTTTYASVSNQYPIVREEYVEQRLECMVVKVLVKQSSQQVTYTNLTYQNHSSISPTGTPLMGMIILTAHPRCINYQKSK